MRRFISGLDVRQRKFMTDISSFLMMFLFFTSCGQVGELNLASKSKGDIVGTDEFVLENVEACEEMTNTGQMQKAQQKITFQDTRVETGLASICPFTSGGEDRDGNLSMEEGQMRARYEQSQSLQLPANAVICDVQLSNNLQRFRYDDVFFLTFNNYVLATNNKSSLRRRLTPMRVGAMEAGGTYDLFSYDWKSLRTAPFENVVDDFCLGKEAGLGACTWPITEQAGKIQFKWEPEVFIRLTANSSQKQTFKFIITGDNDKGVDCYHEKLELDVHVNYYLK